MAQRKEGRREVETNGSNSELSTITKQERTRGLAGVLSKCSLTMPPLIMHMHMHFRIQSGSVQTGKTKAARLLPPNSVCQARLPLAVHTLSSFHCSHKKASCHSPFHIPEPPPRASDRTWPIRTVLGGVCPRHHPQAFATISRTQVPQLLLQLQPLSLLPPQLSQRRLLLPPAAKVPMWE